MVRKGRLCEYSIPYSLVPTDQNLWKPTLPMLFCTTKYVVTATKISVKPKCFHRSIHTVVYKLPTREPIPKGPHSTNKQQKSNAVALVFFEKARHPKTKRRHPLTKEKFERLICIDKKRKGKSQRVTYGMGTRKFFTGTWDL